MKKLISIMLVMCFLFCLIPNASADPEDSIQTISVQQKDIYAGTTQTVSDVFVIDFVNPFYEVSEIPVAETFNTVFYSDLSSDNPSGISISVTVREENNNYYGFCSVSISADVRAGTYWFSMNYGVRNVLSEETSEDNPTGFYSVLTILEAPVIESTVTITEEYRTVSLDEVIFINDYIRIQGTGEYTTEYIKSNGGLLVFTSVPNGDYTIDSIQSCGYIVRGLIGGDNGLYAQRTVGLNPLQFDDEYSLRFYLKLLDNSYLYSELKPYSVNTYCINRIGRSTNPLTVELCQKILDYGIAAERYFAAENGN